jgi:hypothetical protein
MSAFQAAICTPAHLRSAFRCGFSVAPWQCCVVLAGANSAPCAPQEEKTRCARKVTDETNTKVKKAKNICQTFAAISELLGDLHGRWCAAAIVRKIPILPAPESMKMRMKSDRHEVRILPAARCALVIWCSTAVDARGLRATAAIAPSATPMGTIDPLPPVVTGSFAAP